MKNGLKVASLLSIWLLFTISCRKHNNPPAADCISEAFITPASLDTALPQSQLNAIDNLFQLNNLSTANLQFFWIDSNRYQPSGYTDTVSQVEVLAYRWYNNLPVFEWNDNLTFYNDILQPISIIYKGPAPAADTTFHRSLESLRQIYQQNFMKVILAGGPANAPIRHPSPDYIDSCLLAKPGYIGANLFDTTLPYFSSLVKAWRVTPLNGTFPMVYISDSTGAAWPVGVFTP
ncbi:MAG TPA: hypothetical protein VFE32_02125 [Puia sp.]|nr:hypothetical protein [Puia sp.]